MEIFLISIVYTAISVFVAANLFPSQTSLLSIALLTILFVPFFQKIFEMEEQIEDKAARKEISSNLFTRHRKIIYTFSAFFLGVVIAVSIIFVFFSSVHFSLQAETIYGFSNSGSTGNAIQGDTFSRYVANNTQVMLLMFALSVLFGAGAIFILAWNASVIAVFVGLAVQTKATELGAVTAYLYGAPVSLASIALHGIPEIGAYFFAGLAGGILSVGIIREKIRSREFKLIFTDALIFLFLAEFLIIVAAYLEAVF